jgi:coenzyme F420-reducing hydrogenase gamma subunit
MGGGGMKVKDMIEQLWQLDPESDVGICVVNGDDVRIDSIDQIFVRGYGTHAEIGVEPKYGPIPTTI